MALQIALAATCGYLAWTALAALVWAAPVPQPTLPTHVAEVPEQPGFDSFGVIGERNLFGSDKVAVVAPPPVEETIVESKLQVRLFGTAVTVPASFSLATIEDAREHRQIRVGDEIQGAKVTRIERKRVIVDNKGRLEEILLDEDAVRGVPVANDPASKRAAAIRAAQRQSEARNRKGRVSQRVRKLTERLKQQTAQNPTAARAPMASPPGADSLLRQAQVRPRWEGQTMLGLELRRIAEESSLASAGLQDGDVLVSVNGRELTQLAQSYEVLRTASNDATIVLEVDRDGEALTFEIER